MYMNRSLKLWALVGFAFVSLFGTLLHFLYDWLGSPLWIAPFSGVNESTWEHMKLLFWPLFLFALFACFFFRVYDNFWCVKLVCTLVGLLAIPILFYTYNGVIGPSPDWVNIAIFFLSASLTFILEVVLFRKGCLQNCSPRLAFLLLAVIGVLFVIFTFAPPHIGIFRDPITGGFGR